MLQPTTEPWRPPRFYIRAVLKDGAWKTIAINSVLGEKHVTAPGSGRVISAEASGNYTKFAVRTIIEKAHFSQYALKPNGRVDMDESLVWAVSRLDLQIETQSTGVIDLKRAREARRPNPTSYTPSQDEKKRFYALVFSAVRKYAAGQRRIRGLKVMGKDVE
jgi:hypothetical protein